MSIEDLWRETAELGLRAQVSTLRKALIETIDMLLIMQEELQAAHEMLSDKQRQADNNARPDFRVRAMHQPAPPAGWAPLGVMDAADLFSPRGSLSSPCRPRHR